MNHLPPSAGRGFTLVELLVSLSVSVGVVASAYLCLRGGLDTRRLVEERMDIGQKARVALALLAADLAAACPMEGTEEFIGMQRTIGEMEADNIDFAARNWRPRGPGEADTCEVSWFVDRSPETGEFGLWRRRDPALDGKPLEGGIREEIVDGIAGFRCEYFDGYSWYDDWGAAPETATGGRSVSLESYNLGGLPDAVRITLAFRPSGMPSAPGGPALRRRPEREDLRGAPSPGEDETAGDEKEVESSSEEGSGGYILYGTVVRLNLAPRYLLSTEGSSTESTSEESSEPAKSEEGPAPEGGE